MSSADYAPRRGSNRGGSSSYRRGRGRRGGHQPGPPRPRAEEVAAQLRQEFPNEQDIVDSVLASNRGEPIDSLRRLIKDKKYGLQPRQKYEFSDLRDEYRDYMENFQVSFCPGNCVGRECMYYHKGVDEAVRRKPGRLSNGVWKYLPIECKEEGCTDPVCGFAHCLAEVLYHPMTYKTRPCDYHLTSNSICKKYGYHCPYFHEELDDNPLPGFPYSRDKPEEPLPRIASLEDQQDYNERMRHFSDTYVTLPDARKSRISETAQVETSNDAYFARETYKVSPCNSYGCKRDEKCLNYPSSMERRREKDANYSQQPCGYVYDEVTKRFVDPSSCPHGDGCEYAHTENEVFFHRAIFRRKPCLNFLNLSSCPHPYCPFQHERSVNSKLPAPPVLPVAPANAPKEERKLQQPDMAAALSWKIEEAKLNISRLQALVADAESELRILEVSSKCSICQRAEHLYAFSCGHTVCGGCAEDGIKAKVHFCKKCNRPSKGIVRFAE